MRKKLNEQPSSEIYSCATGTRCLDIVRLSTRSCDRSAKKQPPMSVALGSPFLFRINYRRRSVFTACAMKLKSCWKQQKKRLKLNEIRIPMRLVSLFTALVFIRVAVNG